MHHLLERHLSVGVALSLHQLVQNSKQGAGLQVIRGQPLQVKTVEENGGLIDKLGIFISLLIFFTELVTLVSRDGIQARVVRGDIQCTNGYIHSIDRVVFKVSKNFCSAEFSS